MALFTNLTFRQKIVGSFIILILLTVVLVTSSVFKISSTRQITVDKIESLNVRYERTRVALDSFYNLHFLVRKIVTDKENSEIYISDSQDFIDKATKAVEALQTNRFLKRSELLRVMLKSTSIPLTTCLFLQSDVMIFLLLETLF